MSGDATLVIAREVALPVGHVARVRSALIDGGRSNQFPALDDYIKAALGAGNRLSVMISTHYDIDHLNGLTGLLLLPKTYNTTRIYDQGWPQGSLDNAYVNYLRAINGMNAGGRVPALAAVARTRVTNAVRADDAAPTMPLVTMVGPPAVPDNGLTDIIEAPDWLLTAAAPAEILWDGVAGGTPAGAPAMQCIAANRFARTAVGGITDSIGGLGVDPRNEKSLAFVVRFGNFRYYVGGDIETAQENSIQLFLNPANTTAGRVLAMKTSHHGASTATSRAFVDRLRPEAAFISCGTANQFSHPAQATVNVLDGFLAATVAHAAVPPAPPRRPVDSYLTGYQVVNPLGSLGGDASLTAGDPTLVPVQPGTVKVTVSAAQSNSNVLGRLYLGVRAAANAAATALGIAGVMTAGPAAAAAAAGAEAATSAGASAAASAVLTSAGAPVLAVAAAAAAATAAVTAGATVSVTAAQVTAAALGAGAAAGPAAAAGAAAGTAFGGGEAADIANAVTAALVAGGLGALAAAPPAAAAALLAAPATGHFDVALYDRDAMVVNEVITHV